MWAVKEWPLSLTRQAGMAERGRKRRVEVCCFGEREKRGQCKCAWLFFSAFKVVSDKNEEASLIQSHGFLIFTSSQLGVAEATAAFLDQPVVHQRGPSDLCVVQDTKHGHHLDGGHRSWCPGFASQTTPSWLAAKNNAKTMPATPAQAQPVSASSGSVGRRSGVFERNASWCNTCVV